MLDARREVLPGGLTVLRPDWDAPANVHAASTTRHGGISDPPYGGLNLGDHVGDQPATVRENRRLLREGLALAREPVWLEQVHGQRVIFADAVSTGEQADAAVAFGAGAVCVIMTADCLPVLFCDRAGTVVAAAHAGWRGLAGGVLEATVQAMNRPATDLMAWMGPAIGPESFEVGPEVRDAFLSADSGCVQCFRPATRNGYLLADIYGLARRRLQSCGVPDIRGGGACTVREQGDFYSYRREGVCGRMASLIWLD